MPLLQLPQVWHKNIREMTRKQHKSGGANMAIRLYGQFFPCADIIELLAYYSEVRQPVLAALQID